MPRFLSKYISLVLSTWIWIGSRFSYIWNRVDIDASQTRHLLVPEFALSHNVWYCSKALQFINQYFGKRSISHPESEASSFWRTSVLVKQVSYLWNLTTSMYFYSPFVGKKNKLQVCHHILARQSWGEGRILGIKERVWVPWKSSLLLNRELMFWFTALWNSL